MKTFQECLDEQRKHYPYLAKVTIVATEERSELGHLLITTRSSLGKKDIDVVDFLISHRENFSVYGDIPTYKFYVAGRVLERTERIYRELY